MSSAEKQGQPSEAAQTAPTDRAVVSNTRKQRLPGENRSDERPKELGGPAGPEPTRYGDWERGGRCVDF